MLENKNNYLHSLNEYTSKIGTKQFNSCAFAGRLCSVNIVKSAKAAVLKGVVKHIPLEKII